MTDAQLVSAARKKDSEAWNALYERYLPLVWRYAYALTRDVHLAEDITSEAMLAFLKGIGSLDEEAPKISAWLRAVVRHKVADHHRRAYRLEARLAQVEADGRQAVADGTRGNAGPELPLEQQETRNQVLAILGELPERQRLALEWKYVDGLRVKEIADRLGETEKAVEATLYRARREFRRLFQFVEPASAPCRPVEVPTEET